MDDFIVLPVIFGESALSKFCIAEGIDILVHERLDLLLRFSGHATLILVFDGDILVDKLMEVEVHPCHVLRGSDHRTMEF